LQPRSFDSAAEHARASDSATGVTIEVVPLSAVHVEVTALVAEPGPLVAMKLQAIMNRAVVVLQLRGHGVENAAPACPSMQWA
jgi:hypothetical protein